MQVLAPLPSLVAEFATSAVVIGNSWQIWVVGIYSMDTNGNGKLDAIGGVKQTFFYDVDKNQWAQGVSLATTRTTHLPHELLSDWYSTCTQRAL